MATSPERDAKKEYLDSKEYQAAYRIKNRERRNAYFAVRQAENKLEHNAYNAAWGRTHPEARRKHCANRRAQKKDAFVESVDHGVVFERDGYVCGICDQPVTDETPWLDHVVPLSAGGEHSYANTQCSHRICNIRKG